MRTTQTFRSKNVVRREYVERHTPLDLSSFLWRKFLRLQDGDVEGYDATIVISGDTGSGKSELALVLAQQLSMLSGVAFASESDPSVLAQHLVYDKDVLIERIKSLPRYSVIVPDEAVNILFARDDKKNSQLIKVLEICRSRNLAIIFCIPDFSMMDPKVRNSRIRYWVEVRKRGLALEFIRKRKITTDPRRNDPWNNWAFDHAPLKFHPNLVGELSWNRAPGWLRQQYKQVKDEYALNATDDVSEKLSERDKRVVLRFLTVLLGQGEMSLLRHLSASQALSERFPHVISALCECFQVTDQTAKKWLNSIEGGEV